jgi:tetratricopeptide (TPR) repeat protein
MLLVALGLACLPVAPGCRANLAQDNLPEVLRDSESRLEEGRSTLDEKTLTTVRHIFEECVRRDANNSRCYYDLGRTDLYLFQVRQRQKDKKASERCLDSAIESTRRSIVLDDGLADAHALLADLYGNKIGYGGMLAGMRYGPKAEAETKRALQLDRNNPRAYAVLGRRQLYAPKIFGGDIDKAIESFRKSTLVDPNYDEGFVWLAVAYSKKGDSTNARLALDEALRLNGRSAFAKETQSNMK